MRTVRELGKQTILIRSAGFWSSVLLGHYTYLSWLFSCSLWVEVGRLGASLAPAYFDDRVVQSLSGSGTA